MARHCEDCIHNEVCTEWAFTSGIPFVNADTCKHYKKVAPTVSKMEQVRSEVVREIFEEIGKSVTSKIPPYIRPIFKDDRNFEDGFRDGKTDALIEVLMIIAELKKKYTERREGE